jgi:dTDP-4-amino-4,6-dideoxygalactose transaminase
VIGRRQLPVSSTITVPGLAASMRAALGAGADERARDVVDGLGAWFGASAVALTDSGTSALVGALRLAGREGSTVALPAYACVDLLAAARAAGYRVRFYDTDPATLSPDLDSVAAVLRRGADAIVVAHMYGYPADLPGVRALADAAGAVVIEDAAQHAGGSLSGVRLGARGPLTVVSFGRGKGTTAGRGGALMAIGGAWETAVRDWGERLGARNAGWGDFGRAAAQWLVGRPSLYGIPAGIPALGLGETIYHDAAAPEALSRAAAALVANAIPRIGAERRARAAIADRLARAIDGAAGLALVRPIVGGESGFLRLPVLDGAGRLGEGAAGVVRSYPRPLDREAAVAGLVQSREPVMPGAALICERLWTLPTHRSVVDQDIDAIAAWARKSPVSK